MNKNNKHSRPYRITYDHVDRDRIMIMTSKFKSGTHNAHSILWHDHTAYIYATEDEIILLKISFNNLKINAIYLD